MEPTVDGMVGAAAVACVSCRKLKMRCIGAANPPCVRCIKSNRDCVVRLPNRQRVQNHLSSRSRSKRPVHHGPLPSTLSASPSVDIDPRPSPAVFLSADMMSHNSGQCLGSRQRQALGQQNPEVDQATVPSIYSSPPITIAASSISETDCPSSGASAPFSVLGPKEILDSTILDLVEFFCQRLVCYVPVLSLESLDDLSTLVAGRRPLAYAMAFVASTFSPGYHSTRLALAPHILELLEHANNAINVNLEDSWTLLLALAVIYAYPKVAAVSLQGVEQKLNLWAVKSAVENCALQMSLHQSLEALETLTTSGALDITSSLPYRRSFYWLWLFVKSRHHSIITRTPPTIQNDSTIPATLDLLLRLDPPPPIWRVLAETALHRLWDVAGRSDASLAEWWCNPPNTKDITALLELLQNVENLLEEWSTSWLQSKDMSTPSSADSNLLDPCFFAHSITSFMGILTRFTMVSFAAPIVSHQMVLKTGNATFSQTSTHAPELSAFLNCLLKSADAASKCCDTILNLKPAARDILRYMPDYGFTMMALCCLHLIYAYQMSPGNPILQHYLVKAEQVAHLMIDLRVAANLCPNIYGKYVLLHLRKTTLDSHMSTESFPADQFVAHSQKRYAGSHVWPQMSPPMSLDNPPIDSLHILNDIWASNDSNSSAIWPSSSDALQMFNGDHDDTLIYLSRDP